jgi:hypothetical protein
MDADSSPAPALRPFEELVDEHLDDWQARTAACDVFADNRAG